MSQRGRMHVRTERDACDDGAALGTAHITKRRAVRDVVAIGAVEAAEGAVRKGLDAVECSGPRALPLAATVTLVVNRCPTHAGANERLRHLTV